jgi:hypothetical protein
VDPQPPPAVDLIQRMERMIRSILSFV